MLPPSAPPQPPGLPITSGVIEVHGHYRATIVAAFAFSQIREASITSVQVTTGTATGTNTSCSSNSPCSMVTVSSGPHHSSVIAGMSYHLWTYDTFPGVFSWKKDPASAFKEAVGIFAGLSVQNLNDYYVGGDLQIGHDMQLMGGLNFYRQSSLAPGFTNGNVYPGSPSFTGPQHWTRGAHFGIGLNLSIFRKAFGSVTGLGTSTTSSGS